MEEIGSNVPSTPYQKQANDPAWSAQPMLKFIERLPSK